MVKSKTRNLLVVILSVVFALTLISFVVAKPANAEEVCPVETKAEASVRIDPDGKNGIRFTGYVSNDVELSLPDPTTETYLDTDTYAGVIVAKGTYTAEEMKTLSADDVINVPAARMDPLNDTETAKAFNAVIYQIPEVAYAQSLTAVAYLYENGNYTYAENVCVRALAEVASKSLLEDELTAEQIEILKGYVAGANPVLTIGDTVISADATNEVTLVGGEELAISVAPACIAYEASVTTTNPSIKIVDNKISLVDFVTHVDQTVVINMGGVEYTVTVKTDTWNDETLTGNVLANFDTAKSIYSIVDGNIYGSAANYNKSIEWLDAETAKAETGRESGMLKVTALGDYDEVSFKLPRAVKASEVGGIYIKFKMPANMEWVDNDGGGILYGVVNGVSKAIGASWYRTYKAGNGEWNQLNINYYDFRSSFGLTDDSVIESVGFTTIGTDGAETVYYIDEIGIIKSADNVLVDFSAGYYQRAKCVLDVVYPGDADYPTELGSDKPLLKVNQWTHALEMELYVTQLVKVTELESITFKYWVPACEHGGNTTMDYNLNMSLGSQWGWDFSGGSHSAGGPTRGQWSTKTVTPGAGLDGAADGYNMAAYVTNVYLMCRHWGGSGNLDATPWYMEPITFTKKA